MEEALQLPDNEAQHQQGHRKRVKDRFIKLVEKNATSSLQDYEILELVLFMAVSRGDVKPLAKNLLKAFGSFPAVISASPAELKAIKGVGDTAVSALKIVKESSLRLMSSELKERLVLTSWKAVLDYLKAALAFEKKEQFRVMFLDNKNSLIADEVLQQGTIDHTPVYPREVVKRALDLGAKSVILVHNHPSGNPEPSKADLTMTRKIVQAASALEIEVHDHIIIGGSKHYSFRNKGLL